MIWLQLGVIILTPIILIMTVNHLLRKIFKIKKVKRGFFSYNHINESHRKVDWIFRLVAMVVLIVIYLSIMIHVPNVSFYLFVMVITILAIVDFLIRGYFEWRYSEEPKQVILSLAEMIIIVILAVVIITFDLLSVM